MPAYGWNLPKITVGAKAYRSEVNEPMLDLKVEYDTINKIIALYKEGLTELGKDP